jgi:hypothetical protein
MKGASNIYEPRVCAGVLPSCTRTLGPEFSVDFGGGMNLYGNP